MQPRGNTILVTGGSAGIGRELARRWHDAGNQVIVTGRSRSGLDETAHGRPNIHGHVLDVTDAGATTAFAARIVAEHPRLNVLVNNAGIMRLENIAEPRDLSDSEATIATNLLAPIRLTDALLPHLRGQPGAAIVNVSSGLAFVPLVRAAVYSATKAAIHSWTQSLRRALAGTIEVIELIPPGVQTDLTPGQATRPGYMPLEDYIDEVMSLFARQPTPPEIAVERVRPFREAEARGQHEETFAALNAG